MLFEDLPSDLDVVGHARPHRDRTVVPRFQEYRVAGLEAGGLNPPLRKRNKIG
jgi:hypothetical protein